MPFDVLPSRVNGITSQDLYRPVAVPAPPVYDTEKLLHPLMALADYMSPVKKAQRKAQVAEYNYKYWLYTKGDPATIKDPFYAYKVRDYEDKHSVAMHKLKAGGSLSHETPAQRIRRLNSSTEASVEPELPKPEGDLSTMSPP